MAAPAQFKMAAPETAAARDDDVRVPATPPCSAHWWRAARRGCCGWRVRIWGRTRGDVGRGAGLRGVHRAECGGVHESLGGSMGLHAELLWSMGLGLGLWGSMGVYGAVGVNAGLWGPMGLSVGLRWGLWGSLGLYGAQWGTVGLTLPHRHCHV